MEGSLGPGGGGRMSEPTFELSYVKIISEGVDPPVYPTHL